MSTAAPTLNRMPENASPQNHWSGSGQLRGTPAGIHFFIMLLRLFGPRVAYIFSAPVALYFALVSPDVPSTVEFHRRIFGTQPWWKRRWLVCKHFFSFGQMMIDRVAILSGKLSPFSFTFDGEQHLHDAIAERRGVLLLTAHLGNWEAAGQLLSRVKVPINIVGLDRETYSVRSLLTDAANVRFRFITLSGASTDAIPMLAALRRGEIVAMVADRAYGTRIAQVPFLGDLAPFPIGPYMVAAAAGAPLIHVFCVRERSGHYHFSSSPPERLSSPPRQERAVFLHNCAARYAERLETVVRRYPFQWFNFYPFWDAPLPRPATSSLQHSAFSSPR